MLRLHLEKDVFRMPLVKGCPPPDDKVSVTVYFERTSY